MYKLQSNSPWYDGMQFDSFAEAKAKADKAADKGQTCDVIALVDRDTFRVAYTPQHCQAGQALRVTFRK